MIAMIALLVAAAVSPVQKFAKDLPGAKRVHTADGQALSHASGFSADLGTRSPEAAARAFLARYGDAFGVRSQGLTVGQVPPGGTVGAVRFHQTVDGLPVLGGDVVVGVDEQARVFLVNSGAAAGLPSGRHSLDAATAERAAAASLERGTATGSTSVVAGWRSFAGKLRPVYQIDLVAARPDGEYRVVVDAESGRTLFRQDLRVYATAPGSVYEVSPVETKAAACPVSGGVHGKCATPVAVTFPNLTTGANLAGTQTSVFNCKGLNQPTAPANVPGGCTAVAAVSGGFSFTPDSTNVSVNDDFSAAMAYYHLDKHVTYFKTLDPTIPPSTIAGPSGQSRALRGSLPALVNSRQGGAALDNAFFSGGLDAMVFGQGTAADYAYDATVMYHEFTHGVVHAWGGMDPNIDALGGLDETGAVNEGTADSMAVSETGRSEIGGFIGATSSPASKSLRDMVDANAKRTCHGDGTLTSQFGATGVINGLDGEVHDDGEIWNGFFWEVFDGLKTAGIKSCGGACEAGPAIQYKALQLAGGTGQGFAQYSATFKAAAAALFPSTPAVPNYIDCVIKRRALDKCDRTVPVYAGETKLQYVRLRFSPFQMVMEATNETAGFGICSAQGTSTTIHVRKNQPVQITGFNENTGAATFAEDDSATFSQACSGGTTPFTLGTGKWYMLFDSPSALVGGNPGTDIYKVVATAPGSGITARPSQAAPAACTIANVPLAIASSAQATPPKGTLQLAATGGAGGNVFSFVTNASGGTVDASTGAYKAGAVGSVTDVVQVKDSANAVATKSIAVGAGVTLSPTTAKLNSKATQVFAGSGGSGSGYVYSIQPNASGGTIDGAGLYTAGPTGGTTDTVLVSDSLGNTASAVVTINAPPSGGCSTGLFGTPGALLALLAASSWLRRNRSARGQR